MKKPTPTIQGLTRALAAQDRELMAAQGALAGATGSRLVGVSSSDLELLREVCGARRSHAQAPARSHGVRC